MKTIATLLAGVIIGLIADISLYSSKNSDTDNYSSAVANTNVIVAHSEETRDIPISQTVLLQGAQNITPEKAYDFFDAYHGISNPSTKKACLITTDDGIEKEITSLFLPYSGYLDSIEIRVASHEKTFLGLAGIPAYNPDERTHTVIWVPMVSGPEQGKMYYYIPAEGHEGLILDYVDICPPNCPENECVLWKEDWKYDMLHCTDPFN